MGESVPTTERNPGLDAVRVFATFAVLVYHAASTEYSGFAVEHPSVLGPAINRLNVGVPIFFCLSGFLVGRPFIRCFLACDPLPSPGRFLLQRATRVMPAYWFAFAIVVPLGAALPIRDASGYVKSLLLVHTFSLEGVFSGLSQAWTLSVEMFFYLSLPLLYGILAATSRRLGPSGRLRLLIVVLVFLVVSAYGFQVFWWNNRTGAFVTANVWLPAHADALASGMLLAVLVERRRDGGAVSRIADRASSLSGPLLVAGVVLWFASSRIKYPMELVGVDSLRTQILGHALFTASSALFLTPFCLSPSRSRLMRWSSAKPIAWLASISYGIYLWHRAFLDGGLAADLMPFSPDDGRLFPRLAVVIPASIVVAAFSYRFVERPLIRLAKGKNRPRAHGS